MRGAHTQTQRETATRRRRRRHRREPHTHSPRLKPLPPPPPPKHCSTFVPSLARGPMEGKEGEKMTEAEKEERGERTNEADDDGLLLLSHTHTHMLCTGKRGGLLPVAGWPGSSRERRCVCVQSRIRTFYHGLVFHEAGRW